MLSLSSTVRPFSSSTSVYKTLQASQAGPSNVTETFPTIRVSKFSSGIQVTANIFKNQIDFSSLLSVLEEAGLEVVSATSSAINDRVFYSTHLKVSLRYYMTNLNRGCLSEFLFSISTLTVSIL